MTLKAVETHYAGCRFRSRLEARWAVFFETLCLRWRYELQGFDFGEWYLPDFYLPDWKCWVEIKPDCVKHEEVSRCHKLAVSTKETALLIAGDPWPEQNRILVFTHNHPSPIDPEELKSMDRYELDDELNQDLWAWGGNQFANCRRCDGICILGQTGSGDKVTGFESFGDIGPHTCGDHDLWPIDCLAFPELSNRIRDAYTAARSARFGKDGRG